MSFKPLNKKPVIPVIKETLTVSSPAPPIRGLGDVVAKVAQPIAKVIDKIAKTNVSGCGGCKARQEYLNKKFPR